MYVSDTRTPMPSLYTKALPCLCDNTLIILRPMQTPSNKSIRVGVMAEKHCGVPT